MEEWKKLRKEWEERDNSVYYTDKTSHGRMNSVKTNLKQEVLDGMYQDLQNPYLLIKDVMVKWVGEKGEKHRRASILKWYASRGWSIPERKTVNDFVRENGQEIRNRLDNGEPLTKIAEENGFNYYSFHRCMRQQGIDPTVRTQADEIREYYKQGLSPKQIAEKGYKISFVYEVKRRDKLKQQKKK